MVVSREPPLRPLLSPRSVAVIGASRRPGSIGGEVFKNLVATVAVAPSVASRIIRALKEPPRDRKKVKNIKHSGNVTFAEMIKIGRDAQVNSMSKDLKGCILECLGTAVSVGCTIDGEHPASIQAAVKAGKLKIPDK